MERKQASNWYRVLWVSPLLMWIFGFLWPLILLIPIFVYKSKLVSWHGRQALILAGLLVIISNNFTLDSLLWFLVIWFFGTRWGQKQAERGECTLMRWYGHQEPGITPEKIHLPKEVNVPQTAVKEVSVPQTAVKEVFVPQTVINVNRTLSQKSDRMRVNEDDLVWLVRFSKEKELRRKALQKLKDLGLVEEL